MERFKHDLQHEEDGKRYYDKTYGVHVTKVYSGDCCVTDKRDEMMVTILGSCVSACIRDKEKGIGGMNHFLLPDSKDENNVSTRFGAHAMEELINGILKRGGNKNNLEIKLFGGANVIESSAKVGDRNCEFVKNYLLKEGLLCTTQDLGGEQPRRIHYYPATGRVMMRRIEKATELSQLKDQEEKYKSTLDKKSKGGEIGGEAVLF